MSVSDTELEMVDVKTPDKPGSATPGGDTPDGDTTRQAPVSGDGIMKKISTLEGQFKWMKIIIIVLSILVIAILVIIAVLLYKVFPPNQDGENNLPDTGTGSCTVKHDRTIINELGNVGPLTGAIKFIHPLDPNANIDQYIVASWGVPNAPDDNKCKWYWKTSYRYFSLDNVTAHGFSHTNFFIGVDPDDNTKYHSRIMMNGNWQGSIRIIGIGSDDSASAPPDDWILISKFPLSIILPDGVEYSIDKITTTGPLGDEEYLGLRLYNSGGCSHDMEYLYFREGAHDVVGKVTYWPRGAEQVIDVCHNITANGN